LEGQRPLIHVPNSENAEQLAALALQ